MGMRQSQFEALGTRYGQCSSWAVWDADDPKDTRAIAKHLNCLTTSVVMVALNFSRPKKRTHSWHNFHSGGDHARKLMFAFGDSPYRGAYMTDIIKDVVGPSEVDVWKRMMDGTIDVQTQIKKFRTETDKVGVRRESLFVLFGKKVSKLFARHLATIYPNNVSCPHYSKYGKGYTDAEWVEKVWKILTVHSQRTKQAFNTLGFARNDQMTHQLRALRHKNGRRR